jgi:glycosyltransferase involved in cell wall biosynthesis
MKTTDIAISIIIPAFNEAEGLAMTLEHVRLAQQHLSSHIRLTSEIIVVDNASTDQTAEVATYHGAMIVYEAVRGIARTRNTGQRAAHGEMLVFVDADTLVPEETLTRIWSVLQSPTCLGGAIEPLYLPARRFLRLYLAAWKWFGQLLHMSQGATQFFRRQSFEQLGGYDESIFMGEDVACLWRLSKLARQMGGRVEIIRDLAVRPSTRRFDQWPIWRVLLWTNPLVIALCWRWKKAWSGWYESPPR